MVLTLERILYGPVGEKEYVKWSGEAYAIGVRTNSFDCCTCQIFPVLVSRTKFNTPVELTNWYLPTPSSANDTTGTTSNAKTKSLFMDGLLSQIVYFFKKLVSINAGCSEVRKNLEHRNILSVLNYDWTKATFSSQTNMAGAFPLSDRKSFRLEIFNEKFGRNRPELHLGWNANLEILLRDVWRSPVMAWQFLLPAELGKNLFKCSHFAQFLKKKVDCLIEHSKSFFLGIAMGNKVQRWAENNPMFTFFKNVYLERHFFVRDVIFHWMQKCSTGVAPFQDLNHSTRILWA